MAQKKLLAAFDFDHTIVEENSDIVARKLINPDLIPEKTRKLHHSLGWTEYMSEILKLLHKYNISQGTIVGAMQNMVPTPNIIELIKWLKSQGHELIIISDSNSVFIEEWLEYRNLQDCFVQVFTNPASFEENGLLTIQPYHYQDWCQLSTKHLCKGYVLEKYIKDRLEEGMKFEAVAYVGDGLNDFCPALKLNKDDFVFPRARFPLERKIIDPNEKDKVLATVCPWESGTDIMNTLQKLFKTFR